MAYIKIYNTKISYSILIFWILGVGMLITVIFLFSLKTNFANNWTSGNNITYDVDDVLLQSGELSLGSSTSLINLNLIKDNRQKDINNYELNLNTESIYQTILKKKIENSNRTDKEIKPKSPTPGVRFLPIPE